MTTRMTHDEARGALEAAALEALEATEQSAVLAHVETCQECRTELDSLREAVAALAFAEDGAVLARDRRDAMRDRLLARARESRQSLAVTEVAPLAPLRRPRMRPPWLLAAAVVLVVAGGSALLALARQRSSLRGELRAAIQRAAASEATSDSLARALQVLTGADVAVVELAQKGARAPYARMFWDRASNAWTFVAHDLPQLNSGRTYQLWLVTKSAERVSAGTFAPDERGGAIVRANYALPRDALAAVAVTEELEGGAPQPTGAMVISGAPGTPATR